MVAVNVLLGLMILAGLVALEMRNLRVAIYSLGAGGVLFIVISFLMGALEVGIGGVILVAILIPLLIWAVGRTTGEDTTARMRLEVNEIFVLISIVAFIVVLLVVIIPLFPELPSVPEAVEGPMGLSILREVLVLLAALAGVWAVLRLVGRRGDK